MLGLVLPSYLMMLLGTQKCLGKLTSCTLLPNALGPSPSGLRLHHSRLLHPPWHWVYVRYLVHALLSPHKPDDVPEAQGIYSSGPAGDWMGPALMKTWLPPWGVPSCFFVGWPWNGPGLRRKQWPTAGANFLPTARRLCRGCSSPIGTPC
jgi:hypothetical protein